MTDNMTYQEKVDFYKEESRRVTVIAFMFWAAIGFFAISAVSYHLYALKACKEKWHRQGIEQAKILYYDYFPPELKAQMDKYTFERNERFRMSIQ